MTRWFRFYDEALDDPKVQRLSGDLFKTWCNLLSLTSKNDGVLPSVDDIAFRLRISVQDAQQRVEDLILAGLIDVQPDGKYAPHNWADRQFASDSSAMRMQKLRKKKRSENKSDVTGDVTVTVQNHIRSDSDTEPNGLPSSSSAAREGKDQRFFNSIGKGNDGKTKDRLATRAEGLGLDVEALAKTCRDKNAKNYSAYFTSLCVQQLQKQLPGIEEPVIRAALWDAGDGPYTTLQRLLVGAA